MSKPVKYTLYAIMFLTVQILILNQVALTSSNIRPYLYHLLILWLPFSVSRSSLLWIGFFYGLIFDFFDHTQGLHAMACLWIAFMRPFVISALVRQEGQEQNYNAPSIQCFGFARYGLYIIILTLLHHFVVLFLTFLQIGHFFSFMLNTLTYTVVSLFVIFAIEMLISRKDAYRTNT
jgi:hypothetical protein